MVKCYSEMLSLSKGSFTLYCGTLWNTMVKMTEHVVRQSNTTHPV